MDVVIQSFLGFLGRALISIIFIFTAIKEIFDWTAANQVLLQALTAWQTAAPQMAWIQDIASWGIAHVATLLLLAVLFALLGGLLVFLGFAIRLGAFLLFCVTLSVTFVFHYFWNFQEPQRAIEMMHFMKNLGIMGGLLVILSRGNGDSSCGAQQKQEPTE